MTGALPLKVCTSCGGEKPLSEFYRNYGKYRPSCKECSKRDVSLWVKENRARRNARQRDQYHASTKLDPEKLDKKRSYERERMRRFRATEEGAQWCRDKAREARLKDPVPHLIRGARTRAKERGLPFDLDVEWGYQIFTGRCSVSGIEFQQQTGRQSSRSPSIDRINPAVGYVKSNCRFVLSAVNSLKGAAGDDEMFYIAQAILENRR